MDHSLWHQNMYRYLKLKSLRAGFGRLCRTKSKACSWLVTVFWARQKTVDCLLSVSNCPQTTTQLCLGKSCLDQGGNQPNTEAVRIYIRGAVLEKDPWPSLFNNKDVRVYLQSEAVSSSRRRNSKAATTEKVTRASERLSKPLSSNYFFLLCSHYLNFYLNNLSYYVFSLLSSLDPLHTFSFFTFTLQGPFALYQLHSS